jgi:hypothetical protein
MTILKPGRNWKVTYKLKQSKLKSGPRIWNARIGRQTHLPQEHCVTIMSTCSCPFPVPLLSYQRAIMEIKIRIDEVRPHSKGGVLKVMRRAGSVKLEQDAITGLTQRLEKAFKRFSVSHLLLRTSHLIPDQEAMAIVLSRQISDLQEQVSQMQVGFRREFQVLKSNIQINCK